MGTFFYFLVISLVSIGLIVLLMGGLIRLLYAFSNKHKRKGTANMLMMSAGIGSTIAVSIYTLWQFSDWTGQGILGMFLIPIPAMLGAVLGIVCVGLYLEIGKR